MAKLSGQVPGHLSKSPLGDLTRKSGDLPIMKLFIENNAELYEDSAGGLSTYSSSEWNLIVFI
jgi:hypothetical protein